MGAGYLSNSNYGRPRPGPSRRSPLLRLAEDTDGSRGSAAVSAALTEVSHISSGAPRACPEPSEGMPPPQRARRPRYVEMPKL